MSALSNRQMEDEYLAVVRKGYGDGEKGRRGIDSLTQAFGTLIELMEQTRKDACQARVGRVGVAAEGTVALKTRNRWRI